MRFLLDSNAAIALMKRTSERLIARVAEADEDEIALPAMVVHELYYGAYRSQRVARNLEALGYVLLDFDFVTFDAQDARVAAEIRQDLKARGTPIGPYDLVIAGQAKARGLVLVTNNTREFARVAGLRLEDWTQLPAP